MSTMLGGMERLRGQRAIGWRAVLGLLLVPLTAAGVLLWGLWNPTERLDSMTAAVVNLDQPVTVNGQLVPLGRVLAGELIGSPNPSAGSELGRNNFTWVLTDQRDAAKGLDDGRYTTVVTIPENFSKAATSASQAFGSPATGTSGTGATTATIGVETSDRGRLLDSALSNIVTTTATAVLNRQLGEQFVGGVFVGMAELGKGIGEAADGAARLASGSSALADGTDELAGGAAGLASGAAQLSGGASQLSGGAQQLATGAQQLSGGAAELASGARIAAEGGAELAAGTETYVGAVNDALGQMQALAPGAAAQLQSLHDAIAADLVPLPPGADKQQTLERLQQAIAGFDAMGSQLGELIAAGDGVAAGARASANGQAQLAAGMAGLASGAAELSGGMSGFAAGVPTFASGVSQLASGASQLADGTAALAGGARLSADGTAQLADGLQTAAKQVPRQSEAQSESLAKAAVQPVELSGGSDELFNAAGVPLFAGIALWAGALASYLVLAPLWRRTREAARGSAYIALRSAVPAVSIGAAQGAVLGLLLPPLLGYDFGQWLAFFGLSLLAGVSFSLVAQGLSALFGGVGRFAAFALLAVAFAIGVISTAPPLLQAIGDASPVGALFAGFQAIASGVAGAGGAAALLVLWGAGGLLLTLFAVVRRRRGIVQ